MVTRTEYKDKKTKEASQPKRACFLFFIPSLVNLSALIDRANLIDRAKQASRKPIPQNFSSSLRTHQRSRTCQSPKLYRSQRQYFHQLLRLLTLTGLLVSATSLSGCGLFSMRPVDQMSYAMAAFRAATAAGAEQTATKEYKEALQTLKRAKAAYRLKDFKSAHKLSMRSRYLSEVAEFKAIQIASGGTGEEQVTF